MLKKFIENSEHYGCPLPCTARTFNPHLNTFHDVYEFPDENTEHLRLFVNYASKIVWESKFHGKYRQFHDHLTIIPYLVISQNQDLLVQFIFFVKSDSPKQLTKPESLCAFTTLLYL